MYRDVYLKIKKGNKLLFNRDSQSLQEILKLIRSSSRKNLILWALDNSQRIAENCSDQHLQEEMNQAISLAKDWSHGYIKMNQAKAAILNLHALAKLESNIVNGYYLQAVGQGLSTIHVETHAIGLIIYELSGIVASNNYENFESEIDQSISNYIESLNEISNQDNSDYEWAKFIIDQAENKELELYKKRLRQ